MHFSLPHTPKPQKTTVARIASFACFVACVGTAPAWSQTPGISQIQLGQAINGTLVSNTELRLDNGTYFQAYEFQGRAGQRLTARMESTAVDSFLAVLGPGDFAQSNDDSGGTLNSTLDFVLPSNGTYTLVASSAIAGQTGSFQISLATTGSPAPRVAAQAAQAQLSKPPPAPAQGPAPAPPAPAPARANSTGAIATGQIVSGRPVTGNLERSDPTLADGSHYDRYDFSATQGARITLSLQSRAFDPVLILTGPNNFQQINDDVTSGNLNSRLEFVVPTTGVYTATANSVAAGATGTYTLEMTGGAPPAAARPQAARPQPARQQPARQQAARTPPFNANAECPPMPAGANPNTQGRRLASGGPLNFDEPVCGRLQQGDQALDDGTFVDLYTINLQADGGTYQAILVSEGFEPITLVLAPNSDASGVELMPIASGRNLNTVITPRVSGAFTIAVNSAQPGSGRYRLRVVRTRD